jgi:hypothetical protein
MHRPSKEEGMNEPVHVERIFAEAEPEEPKPNDDTSDDSDPDWED